MYLWGDFPHVTLATAWFEFVFYFICFWEAVFCMLAWWADFKQRDGADGAYACFDSCDCLHGCEGVRVCCLCVCVFV